ncbi:MAG: EAL domain-containing protein [Acidimicrobiia bacterium]|nr:EAL domain-containing protein [Acidimicrobiia bacterium]
MTVRVTTGPALVLHEQILPIKRYTTVLGRFDLEAHAQPDIDLGLLGLGHLASRRHAQIEYRDGAVFIRDLGSVLGTVLNGELLGPDDERQLFDGDTVTVGNVVLAFERAREWPAGATAEWEAGELPSGSTITDPGDLAIPVELSTALKSGQLRLFYQPQIVLATGASTSVEALIRWQHPGRGMVGPDKFVPGAERTGFIRRLTDFVLVEAAAQARRWREEGTPRTVSVNVSVRDLEDADIERRAAIAVEHAGAQASDLLLEITESAAMSRPSQAMRAIACLRDAGFRFGIDDFGKGESSLAYLSKLAVDEVKLDLAFATDLHSNNESIVRGTVGIGHELGLVVVAEGIEEETTADKLRELGCDKGQGYFFGRPAPPVTLQRH